MVRPQTQQTRFGGFFFWKLLFPQNPVKSAQNPPSRKPQSREDEMPDIYVATAAGQVQKLQEIEPQVFAPVMASAYGGAGVISDNTGQFRFDVNSLASTMTYDDDGNQLTITYGPDLSGRRIMQTSVWGVNNQLMHDSDWQLVNAAGQPVDGNGSPL